MANTLYKAAVRELEAVLSPRLVSQALHEGLANAGKTAETLTLQDAEAILQNRVLPRLTSSLGEAKAKETAQGISGRLIEAAAGSAKALTMSAQARQIGLLQAAAKPFNIYFEWSETQKLRAQLSLIENEHAAGRSAAELLAAAQVQLGVLQQKLNDQLAVQARELALLETTWQEHSVLKSPKVRRLSGLLELIRGAQEAQQRVPAEVERAHQLAGDLRAEKLRISGEEARELRALPDTFSTLLTLEPTLAEKLTELQKQVAEGTLLGETLKAFRGELEARREALRRELQAEFRVLNDQLGEAEQPELGQLLTLSLKVLDKMLPPAADVIRIRDLLRGGDSGSEQLADFHRLETDAADYRAVPNEPGRALAAFLAEVRETLEAGRTLPDLGEGWALLEAVKAEQQRSVESFETRLRAVQDAAASLSSLNSDAALTLRGQLRTLTATRRSPHATAQLEAQFAAQSPKQQAKLEAQLQDTEALILNLQEEAEATRTVASQLLAGNDSLDDLLGGFDFFAAPAKPATSAQKSEKVGPENIGPEDTGLEQKAAQLSELSIPPHKAGTVQGWLERQAAQEGVAGLALFADHAATLVSGDLPTETKTLQRAVRLSKRRADTLGKGLGRGHAATLTVETEGYTLLIFWLSRAYSLALVTYAPGWLGVAQRSVAGALPELTRLLEPVATPS